METENNEQQFNTLNITWTEKLLVHSSYLTSPLAIVNDWMLGGVLYSQSPINYLLHIPKPHPYCNHNMLYIYIYACVYVRLNPEDMHAGHITLNFNCILYWNYALAKISLRDILVSMLFKASSNGIHMHKLLKMFYSSWSISYQTIHKKLMVWLCYFIYQVTSSFLWFSLKASTGFENCW